ncbi:hypothetical protein Bca52824_024550 [Brassica carinata]|uniref:Uncharacterized protein n=1 Tax=Brassica carinata TaxID=52824 RepID=A0A8X7VJV9_BRACI|nr:hypothetical protein Bca52824_024550 [Brassica carinata]
MVNSTKGTERKARQKQNDGNKVHVETKLDRKRAISVDIPLPSVFNRLYEGVGYIPVCAVPSPANQRKIITPCTPTNNSKCYKSMDCGTGQASTGGEQDHGLACNTLLIYPILDRLEEDLLPDTFQCQTSGDDSEEDANPSAYDSDFADRFDENFQADLDCSSQENTDSDLDPEIEVLDSTVTKEPDNVLNRDRIKSLASLLEEAFRATEKPAKKTVPKEDEV